MKFRKLFFIITSTITLVIVAEGHDSSLLEAEVGQLKVTMREQQHMMQEQQHMMQALQQRITEIDN